MEMEGNPEWKNSARNAGTFSFAFSVIGLLFIAVPIPGVAAVITGSMSVRASRKIDESAHWAAILGTVLGVAELAFAAWFYTQLFTGQISFH